MTLRRCPFCGSVPHAYKSDGAYRVHCLAVRCLASGPRRMSSINAAKAWNAMEFMGLSKRTALDSRTANEVEVDEEFEKLVKGKVV